jgi:hypothetical protein
MILPGDEPLSIDNKVLLAGESPRPSRGSTAGSNLFAGIREPIVDEVRGGPNDWCCSQQWPQVRQPQLENAVFENSDWLQLSMDMIDGNARVVGHVVGRAWSGRRVAAAAHCRHQATLDAIQTPSDVMQAALAVGLQEKETIK